MTVATFFRRRKLDSVGAAPPAAEGADQKALAVIVARDTGADRHAASARLAEMVEQMVASQRELHEIQHRSRWKRMFRNGVADVARATARIAETQHAMVLFIATLLELQGSSSEMLATLRAEITRIRADLGLTARATATVGEDVLSTQRLMDQLLGLVEATERRRTAEVDVDRPRASTPPARRASGTFLIVAAVIALVAAVAIGLVLR